MALGPLEIGLFVLLGALALLALFSLLVAVVLAIAAGISPVLAGIADRVRRYRWRNWHPPTDWVPYLDHLDKRVEQVSGVIVVHSRQLGANVDLLTAHLPDGEDGHQHTMTAVHATLAPHARLDLPGDAHADVAVLVVSGSGTVGTRRRVSDGDVAVLEPGEPVSVIADDRRGTAALEVVVLGGVPAAPIAAVELAKAPEATPQGSVTKPTPAAVPALVPVALATPPPPPVLASARTSSPRGRPAAV